MVQNQSVEKKTEMFWFPDQLENMKNEAFKAFLYFLSKSKTAFLPQIPMTIGRF